MLLYPDSTLSDDSCSFRAGNLDGVLSSRVFGARVLSRARPSDTPLPELPRPEIGRPSSRLVRDAVDRNRSTIFDGRGKLPGGMSSLAYQALTAPRLTGAIGSNRAGLLTRARAAHRKLPSRDRRELPELHHGSIARSITRGASVPDAGPLIIPTRLICSTSRMLASITSTTGRPEHASTAGR